MSSLLRGVPAECLRTNGLGSRYAELACLYPTLGKFYLPFELSYDPAAVLRRMQAAPHVPVLACLLYALCVAAGRAHMATRPAGSWRRALAAWNLSLSLFSWLGACRTAPQLYHNLTTHALRDNLCADPATTYGSGATGLWIQLFILSKFPELWDTFFLVVHKKPLLFLHWYHHLTVLLYCWHSYVTTSPSGIFFVVMNYAVHAVMYGYYFLTAVKRRPAWFHPMVVTCLQLGQMFAGMGVTVLAYYYYVTPAEGTRCHVRQENNVAAFLMYGSYFYLFARFFCERYCATRVRGAAKEKRV